MQNISLHSHRDRHAFVDFYGHVPEGMTVRGRRSMLKAGLAGIAGLSLPGLIAAKESVQQSTGQLPRQKCVILIWMTGGPSHIDTWDVKPNAPTEIRGPFGVIPTALPGIQFCEFLPKQAAMMKQMTVI
ncbi:MAG: DUF1501 domain-containing protein, partial [Planctomycetes bacterium]|nr:DUF1501 domain-containing protein [Planctomycetota bacterium]